MCRKILFVFVKVFGKRRHILVFLPVAAWVLIALASCFWLSGFVTKVLLPPPPPDQNLEHFRRNRSLEYYLDNINLLIEPTSTSCSLNEVQVVALVATAPARFDHRQTIRETWGKHQPTYFVLGLDGDHIDEQLVDTYVEAKLNGDMVVWDFKDHYQNLTLKTALMLQWTLTRCSRARFLFKIDDDVLLNPWRLADVLRDNAEAELLGYKMTDRSVHRDEYTKWFMPRWLYPEEVIPEYLAGPGYLVNTAYIEDILTAAKAVPLVNLEDVYFTYLVAKRRLGLTLTHDERVNPYKPRMPSVCGYWPFASAHSLSAEEMSQAWAQMERQAGHNSSCHVHYAFGSLFVF